MSHPIPSFMLPLVLAAVCFAAAAHSNVAGDKPAPEDDTALPPDYVTMFPTWQRAFIHDGRLIHAAGEHGIMQALFSSAIGRKPGEDTRVLLPFTHLDSDSRIPGRPGPSPFNSIHPSLPPLLYCWDVDHDQIMLVFARVKPIYEFYLRFYSPDSIGGPVRELPSYRTADHIKRYPDKDVFLSAIAIDSMSGVNTEQWHPLMGLNDGLYLSFRMLPKARYETMLHVLGFWHVSLRESSDGISEGSPSLFMPAIRPEPFHHFVLGEQFFRVRRSGALERIPRQLLEPGRQQAIYEESIKWKVNPTVDGFIFDEEELAAGRIGDVLDLVGEFNKIPDWVASDPASHFMVQDRDHALVHFFWGVSGYARLKMLDRDVQDKENADKAKADGSPRVSFEELPAPQEMEDLRALLLSPPEFERPKTLYIYDPRIIRYPTPEDWPRWKD